MSIRTNANHFIDWFIPADRLADREKRTRTRMFLFSHLIGPFLGNVIPAYLFFFDPSSSGTLSVLAISITSFWLYPLALRVTGRYELLSYLSIQNLLFAILWGSFFYGGISSPFLPWLVTVPLLAFFYIGATTRSVAAILSQVTVSGISFVVLYRSLSDGSSRVSIHDLQAIGIISIISAAIYVSLMAMFYTDILNSQSELEVEVDKHLVTANELRDAAAQAERAIAAKSEFLAKMSHELRTPLNAVIGYSEILLEDTDMESEQQIATDLDRIHAAGTRLLSIVNSILDLSKIEAGKMDVHTSTVAIAPLVEDVSHKHMQAARTNATALEIAVEETAGEIETDANKLARVLDTLIENALQFTVGGRVRVTAERSRHGLALTVADTGCGIPPEVLPTLFQDFTQRSDQSVSSFAGAGLGLPLAQRLCDLLGAKISIRSEVGVGTSVTVHLPLAPRPSPAKVEPTDPSLLKAA